MRITTDHEVKVIRFADAPEGFRKFSPFGGDEDFVVVGKDAILVDAIARSLMVCDYETTIDGAWHVAITCHA